MAALLPTFEEQLLSTYREYFENNHNTKNRASLYKLIEDADAPLALFNLLLNGNIDLNVLGPQDKQIVSRMFDIFSSQEALKMIKQLVNDALQNENHPLFRLLKKHNYEGHRILQHLCVHNIITEEQKKLYLQKIPEVKMGAEIYLKRLTAVKEFKAMAMCHNVLSTPQWTEAYFNPVKGKMTFAADVNRGMTVNGKSFTGKLQSEKEQQAFLSTLSTQGFKEAQIEKISHYTQDAGGYIFGIISRCFASLHALGVVSNVELSRNTDINTNPLSTRRITSNLVSVGTTSVQTHNEFDVNFSICGQEYRGMVNETVEVNEHLQIPDIRFTNLELLELLCVMPWGLNDPKFTKFYDYVGACNDEKSTDKESLLCNVQRIKQHSSHLNILFLMSDLKLGFVLSDFYPDDRFKIDEGIHVKVTAIRKSLQKSYDTVAKDSDKAAQAAQRDILLKLYNLVYNVSMLLKGCEGYAKEQILSEINGVYSQINPANNGSSIFPGGFTLSLPSLPGFSLFAVSKANQAPQPQPAPHSESSVGDVFSGVVDTLTNPVRSAGASVSTLLSGFFDSLTSTIPASEQAAVDQAPQPKPPEGIGTEKKL